MILLVIIPLLPFVVQSAFPSFLVEALIFLLDGGILGLLDVLIIDLSKCAESDESIVLRVVDPEIRLFGFLCLRKDYD